jgi:hypothetical protein
VQVQQAGNNESDHGSDASEDAETQHIVIQMCYRELPCSDSLATSLVRGVD